MEYKPCIYCGRSIRKGSPVDLCINCLQEAKTPEEFIKEIEAAKAMENIDGLIEAGIKKTEREIRAAFIGKLFTIKGGPDEGS